MKRADRALVFIAILLSLAARAQNSKNPPVEAAPVSKEHRAACKAAKSPIADAYCKSLDEEFGKGRFANKSYPPDQVLMNPMEEEILFTAAVFRKAYLRVVSSSLKADAKSLATSALDTEANQLAQVLSTKATVPQTGANA